MHSFNKQSWRSWINYICGIKSLWQMRNVHHWQLISNVWVCIKCIISVVLLKYVSIENLMGLSWHLIWNFKLIHVIVRVQKMIFRPWATFCSWSAVSCGGFCIYFFFKLTPKVRKVHHMFLFLMHKNFVLNLFDVPLLNHFSCF